MITIVLADDHKIVRQGIKAMLKAEADFNVIGEAADGLEAVRMVKRLQPDILVSDLIMPGLDGIEVTRQLAASSTKTRVVILSVNNNIGYVSAALEAGARSYVLKEDGIDQLEHAIREVVAGRIYLCSSFSDEALKEYRQKAKATEQDSNS